MRREGFLMLATAGLLGVAAAGQARAQAPLRPGGIAPVTTPAYSPYLNLLRPGNPVYQNYYGLVRPEQEFRSNIQALQRQEAMTQEAVASAEATSTLPPTGHQTTFLNNGGYFLNNRGGAPAQRQPAASLGGAPRPAPRAGGTGR
jgi:hypothetical protein